MKIILTLIGLTFVTFGAQAFPFGPPRSELLCYERVAHGAYPRSVSVGDYGLEGTLTKVYVQTSAFHVRRLATLPQVSVVKSGSLVTYSAPGFELKVKFNRVGAMGQLKLHREQQALNLGGLICRVNRR